MSDIRLRAPIAAHALSADAVVERLGTSPRGLSAAEAAERLARFGTNAVPRARAPGLGTILLRQFNSPLNYLPVVRAAVSLVLSDWLDSTFIFLVLLINAVIGTFEKHAAERSSAALKSLVTLHARVEREGAVHDLKAESLMPS